MRSTSEKNRHCTQLFNRLWSITRTAEALCQGSTFSLACHESEAGSGGCVRGCVRQQVQLGLPRQEVGRACVSYLIYGRAAGTLPARANEKRKEQEGKGGGQLPLHPKWKPSGISAVYSFSPDTSFTGFLPIR
ncbi:uncharacterized [Tachysurus ichikawai]